MRGRAASTRGRLSGALHGENTARSPGLQAADGIDLRHVDDGSQSFESRAATFANLQETTWYRVCLFAQTPVQIPLKGWILNSLWRDGSYLRSRGPWTVCFSMTVCHDECFRNCASEPECSKRRSHLAVAAHHHLLASEHDVRGSFQAGKGEVRQTLTHFAEVENC